MAKIKLVLAALLSGFLVFLGAGTAFADPVKAPPPNKPVVDTTGTLTPNDISTISKTIANKPEDPEVAQIAVLFTSKVGDLGLEDSSRQVADAWGLGSKKRKNGILLYVAKDDRKMRIEVASGIGPSVTDTFTKRVINDVLKPKFKENDYAGGITDAVSELRKASSNPDYAATFEPEPIDFGSIFVTLLSILAGVFSAIATFFLGKKTIQKISSNRKRKDLEKIINSYFNAGAYNRDVNFLKEQTSNLAKQVNTLSSALAEQQVQIKVISPKYWESVAAKAQVAGKLAAAKAILGKIETHNASMEKNLIKKWKGSSAKAPQDLRGKISREQSRRASYDSSYSSGYIGGYSSSGNSFSGGSSFDSGGSFGGGGGFDGGGSSGGW